MKAFTLIELLVVCAIVAVLAAIMFPVLVQAKASANATTCVSQERQIGIALSMYASDHDDNAPTAGEDGSENGSSELNAESWMDDVQPYVQTRLIYRCPTDQSQQWEALVSARQTSYGLNAYFAPNHPPFFGFSFDRVARPAEAILVAELADWVGEDHFAPMYWGDPSHCQDEQKQKDQWDGASHMPKSIEVRRHAAGSNYLFTDLHVKKLRFDQLWSQPVGVPPLVDNFDPAR